MRARDFFSQAQPAPRHIPRTEDLQSWLDRLVEVDPLRGWVMAMIATYGVRGISTGSLARWPPILG